MIDKIIQQIYILEDSCIQASYIASCLSEEEYEVSIFKSAENVLQQLEQATIFPSVIIIDYNLPEMNGIEFLEAVQQRKYPVITIFLSAYDKPEIIVKAVSEGAYDFLIKDDKIAYKLPLAVNRAVEFHKTKLKNALINEKLEQERKLFSDGPLVVFKWQFSEGWPVLYVSKNIGNLGFTEDYFENNKHVFVQTIAPSDIRRVGEEVESFIENKVDSFQQSYKIITPLRGEITIFDYTFVIRNQQGKIDYLIGYLMDISDWQKSKETIFKLSSAVTQSKSVVMITDLQSRIEFVNPYFHQLTNFTAEEVIGQKPSMFGSNLNKDECYAELHKKLQNNETWNGVFFNKKASGEEYWERASISTIFNEHKEKIGYVKIGEDITQEIESKRLLEESEKNQREANQAKNKLLSVIGHDLRGPVGSMKSLIDFIIENPEHRREEVFHMLQDTAAETFTLLENLLLWAKNQQDSINPTPEIIDLYSIASSVKSLMSRPASQKNIEIIINKTSDKKVFADLDMINSVFRNIISNALKFTPEGGEITISFIENEQTIQTIIKDTGIGISQEDINKILDPKTYFTTYGTNDEKGSGLGLQLSFDFIRKSNGNFRIESEQGKGTSMIFQLPKEEKKQ